MKLRMLLGGLALAAATAGPGLADDNIKIGFITKFPVPFFATMENAAKAYAAAHPGVEVIFGQGTSATDIEGQIALIESMVTKGVKGIAVTPVDPTVAAALDKAIAAGVKVVLMDNNIPDWKGRTALATTNNYHAGEIAGQYLKSVLKNGDTLGILEGVPGVPSLDGRPAIAISRGVRLVVKLDGFEDLREGFLALAELEEHPAKAVKIGGVFRLQLQRFFDHLAGLGKIFAAFGPHIAEVIQRFGKFRRQFDRFAEMGLGLLKLLVALARGGPAAAGNPSKEPW